MLNKYIDIALNHSPRHKGDIAAALVGVERSDILTAALVVKKKCDEHRIVDFPNPFPRDTKTHDIWASVWSPVEETVERAVETEAKKIELPQGFAKLTKAKIEAWALESFGVNLNTDNKKAKMITDVEALVANQ